MKPKRAIQILFAALAFTGTGEIMLISQEMPPALLKNPSRPGPGAGGQRPFLAGLGPLDNVLTDEQRASFRQAMESQREKMRDAEVKLREARIKMFEASLDGKFDEAAARKQALAVAALEADLSVIRARALSQLQPPLSPEQIEKVKNGFGAPARVAERLQPAGERRHNLTSTNRDENDLPRNR